MTIEGQQLSTHPVEAEPASELLAHPPPVADSVLVERFADEFEVPISVYGRIDPIMINKIPKLPRPTTHFLPYLR